MTNDSETTPKRKTLSIKRPRPADAPIARAPRETVVPREAAPARETPAEQPRAGRLFALDDHMRRMQADMDQLGSKKDSSPR